MAKFLTKNAKERACNDLRGSVLFRVVWNPEANHCFSLLIQHEITSKKQIKERLCAFVEILAMQFLAFASHWTQSGTQHYI